MTESPRVCARAALCGGDVQNNPDFPRVWLRISAASFFFCARASAKIKSSRGAFSLSLRGLASGQTANIRTLLPPTGGVSILLDS